MAAAGLALSYFAPSSANDNDPPDKEIDRWRLLIDGFKRMNLPTLAIATIEYKLKGWDFDAYCEMFLEMAAKEWGLAV